MQLREDFKNVISGLDEWVFIRVDTKDKEIWASAWCYLGPCQGQN